MEELVIYNVIYFLFAFFLIFPPSEVQALGFSIPTLFGELLGSEQLCFIHHHIARLSLTVFVHSLLPLGYYIFLGVCAPELALFSGNAGMWWHVYLLVAITCVISMASLVYYWSWNDYSAHPIVRTLYRSALVSPSTNGNSNSNSNSDSRSPTDASWKHVANAINIELRRIDKFQTGTLYNRVYVTDTWLIKVSLYAVAVCRHRDAEFTLAQATEMQLTQDSSPSVQYLHIAVQPATTSGTASSAAAAAAVAGGGAAAADRSNSLNQFVIVLKSNEYADFIDKIQRPVAHATDVLIKQSLTVQFIDEFRDQVFKNESVSLRQEDVETCVGCMRKPADVRLLKRCDHTSQSPICQICRCRPMWCIECLGKWFAYRQDQTQPSSWLSGKATCCTCRSTFCMLDVAPIRFIDE